MLQLRGMTVARRLGLLVTLAFAGVMVLALVFIASERRLLMQERQDAVRQTVEVAHGLVAMAHREMQEGQLTEADAKRRALEALRGLRYSGKEYFWVNDMLPRMVMHPINPKLEGQDLSENKDPTGKRLFVEFVKVVRERQEGTVSYLWPKPGSQTPVEKVSYVKGFSPWGWVIGSGVYVDTVDSALWSRALTMGLSALALGVGVLVSGGLIARSLLRQLGGEPAYYYSRST